jgi:hypothetical protein
VGSIKGRKREVGEEGSSDEEEGGKKAYYRKRGRA